MKQRGRFLFHDIAEGSGRSNSELLDEYRSMDKETVIKMLLASQAARQC